MYRGPDAVEQFLAKVVELGQEYQQRVNNIKPLTMGNEDWRKFNGRNGVYGVR